MNATASKPTSAPVDTTVRLEELPLVHTGLARAFGEVGIGGQQLDDIFSLGVTATCIGCGIRLTGNELAHLAVAATGQPNAELKLDRLRLGYCARKGCTAKFYRIECENLPGLDAAKVVARGLELRNAPPPEVAPDPEAPPPPAVPWWKQPRRLLLLALLAVVVIWGFRFAADKGLVPGVEPKRTYKPTPAHSREAL